MQLKPNDFNRLRRSAHLILSYHDFRGTKKLEETFAKMQQHPSDFIKIVTTANSLYDNVVMMKFLEKYSHAHSLIGLCMGEQGVISRCALRARRQPVHFCRRQSRRRNCARDN